MMASTVLNSPLNVGPIKFDYSGITPAALVDCNFSCLRPSSSVRLTLGSSTMRATDSEYEAAVVAGNLLEESQVSPNFFP